MYVVITDSVCKETLRNASGVFMVRDITADTDFTLSNGEVKHVRKGDKVAMYPPCFNKDPETFENPEVSIYRFR